MLIEPLLVSEREHIKMEQGHYIQTLGHNDMLICASTDIIVVYPNSIPNAWVNKRYGFQALLNGAAHWDCFYRSIYQEVTSLTNDLNLDLMVRTHLPIINSQKL